MTQRNPRSGDRAFEDRLEVLCAQAFELRGSGYVHDAVDAIVEWHDRRALTEFEHREQRLAELKKLLRETDPRRRAAA